MLMADPAAALAETRRVLRQGGRLSFSVWAAPDHNPWATVSGTAMVQHGHVPPPEPGAPGIFGLTDPEHIRALVRAAGFDQPRIEEVPLEWRFDDFEDYWKFVSDLAGAIALAIERLSEEEREPVRDTMREAAAPFASNGGYVMPGLCLNVVAG
jgi:SAM-dependent methyltransferase